MENITRPNAGQSNAERVSAYLNEAGIFYLTTLDDAPDGARPRCRPISFSMVLDDTLYFGVGTFKDVYRQIEANAKVEICACKDGGWLRYYGTSVVSDDPAMQEKALEAMPALRGIYNEETGYELAVFTLSPAVAEFRSMLEIEESLEF